MKYEVNNIEALNNAKVMIAAETQTIVFDYKNIYCEIENQGGNIYKAKLNWNGSYFEVTSGYKDITIMLNKLLKED